MGHILNTERMRVVERNERGNVTYRKRYKRGDTVDVSHMDEAHVENLINDGVLVDSEEDLTEQESAGATSPTSPPFGGATVASTPGDEGPSADDIEQSSDGSEEEHDVDECDSMDYQQLQAESKSRDLRHVGVSAEDMRASLRADDSE